MRNQGKEELDSIGASRKRLEANYQSRIKVLGERESELKEELKALAQEADNQEIVPA